MADYNIYIRTVGGESGDGNPVKPFQTGGGDGGGDAAAFAGKAISQVGAIAQNPDNAIGSVASVGVGAISKAVPWIGVAVIAFNVVTKVGDNIYSKYTDIYSSLTGDYRQKNRYNNLKAAIHLATHPVSTLIAFAQEEMEIRKQNQKLEQERLLTGGTILNAEYGRYL